MAVFAGGPQRQVAAQDEDRIFRVLGGSQLFELPFVSEFFTESGFELDVTPIATPDDVPLFLNAGGVGLYDLAVTNHGLIQQMAGVGLLQPIAPAENASVSSMFPPFQRPSWSLWNDEQYGVPVLWGSLATALRSEPELQPPASLLDLFSEPYTGQVVMSDDVLGHFWVWSRALGVDDPALMTIDQLNATTELLIRLKREQARSFESTVYGGMRKMAEGRGLVSSVGWQTASLIPLPGEQPLIATVPEPGAASFCDVVCLPAGAPHRDLAMELVNVMLLAESQAEIVNSTKWATVLETAVELIEPDVRDVFDYGMLDAVIATSPFFGYPPRSTNTDNVATYLDWIVAWDRVKTAKK